MLGIPISTWIAGAIAVAFACISAWLYFGDARLIRKLLHALDLADVLRRMLEKELEETRRLQRQLRDGAASDERRGE